MAKMDSNKVAALAEKALGLSSEFTSSQDNERRKKLAKKLAALERMRDALDDRMAEVENTISSIEHKAQDRAGSKFKNTNWNYRLEAAKTLLRQFGVKFNERCNDGWRGNGAWKLTVDTESLGQTSGKKYMAVRALADSEFSRYYSKYTFEFGGER